ncbi:DNA primase [Rahnella rivi]|uniref:DNA primase n=1 Tax=Rahnella rivi TaxID=2816249 RepID=UPI0039BE5EA0
MSMKIKGFAHLFGHSAKSSEDDEDEKEKSKKAKGRRAEEDENDGDKDKEDKDKSKKSKRAEEDDDSDDEDDNDKEKSKKAKGRSAEDDDDGDDDEDNHDVKKGRRAERNRISRILGSKYAAGKGPLAVSLAITTGMSSASAIRVLASSGPVQVPQQSRRLSLDERMSKVENHQLGNDDAGPSGNANTVVTRAAALYNQVKGKK